MEPDAFAVSLTDRGLLHGLGLFETLLAVDGVPVFADRHLDRMASAARALGWELPGTELIELMSELLVRNRLVTGRARIRLAATAGSGAFDDLARGGDARLWMTAAAVDGSVRAPLRLMRSPWTRNECSPLAGMKCASYAENLVARRHARQLGFDEVVVLNNAGALCEAATANLFLVKNGRVRTPGLDSGCLPGVTRAVVIELALKAGMEVDEARLSLDDLMTSDECFLTSAVQGVVVAGSFDSHRFTGGEIAKDLGDAWHAQVRHLAEAGR